MTIETEKATVLKKEGSYYLLKTENGNNIPNVQNTIPIEINTGDSVVVGYDKTLNNPIIVGVYNKTVKGDDGHSPILTISSDGYWVIDGVKTSQKAQGDKGDNGSTEITEETYGSLVEEITNSLIPIIKNQIKGEIKDEDHPVGSYFWSNDISDPSIQLNMPNTVWERVKDRFMYAIGDSDTSGKIGGSSSLNLSITNLPKQQGSFWTEPNTRSFQANGVFSIGSSATATQPLALGTATTARGVLVNFDNGGSGSALTIPKPPYRTAYCWYRVS